MKKLFLYGAGSVGREVSDIAERLNSVEPQWEEIGFIDDTRDTGLFRDRRLFQYCDFVKQFSIDDVEIVIANGEPAARKTLSEKVRADGYRLASVIDKTAFISPSAQLGEGVIIYPLALVSADATIKDNVLVSYHTTVAHDCVIGESSVLSIGVIIAGGCTIADHCFIGAGATVRELIEVGEWSILAMSSVMCKSGTENGIYMGNPARRVRENLTKRVFK